MAGAKGRSGGPRPNSGGARPNSGPKPREVTLADTEGLDPLSFLLFVQNSGDVPADLRIRAATAAAQYVHAKKGEDGKKGKDAAAAKNAASKLIPLAPPRLVAKTG